MTEPDIQSHGLESLLQSAPGNGAADSAVHVQIQSGLVQLNLRGDADDEHFVAAVEAALGQTLPTSPNTATFDKHRVYWLGPNEWLILADSQSLAGELQESLVEISGALNDISGGQIVLRIAGTHVRDVLARGCTLDFHPQVFTAGMCAQSGLAKASVLIALVNAADTFDVIVRRSFSDYLVRWLQHTGEEFGVTLSA
jgi:sarcosine oxidase subunit gamma